MMHLESRFYSSGIQNFMVLGRKMQIFRNLICKRRHYKLHKTIFKSVRFDLDFEIWAETWCAGNQNFDVFSVRGIMTFDPQNELTRQKLHTGLHYIISATREWPGLFIWMDENFPTLKKKTANVTSMSGDRRPSTSSALKPNYLWAVYHKGRALRSFQSFGPENAKFHQFNMWKTAS